MKKNLNRPMMILFFLVIAIAKTNPIISGSKNIFGDPVKAETHPPDVFGKDKKGKPEGSLCKNDSDCESGKECIEHKECSMTREHCSDERPCILGQHCLDVSRSSKKKDNVCVCRVSCKSEKNCCEGYICKKKRCKVPDTGP